MSALSATYTRELRNRLGYSATWVPTLEIRLGDVGRLQDHGFEHVTTLADLGIPFGKRSTPATSSIDYTSEGGVSLEMKAAGTVPPLGSGLGQAEAGIIVSFSSKDATVLTATGCVTSSVEDLRAVQGRILELHGQGEWDDDYVAVTEVVAAACTTVLISSGSDGSVVFSAAAGVELGPLSIASTEVGLRVSSYRNIGTRIVAEGGLTPLFRAHGIRRRWFRPADLTRRGSGSVAADTTGHGPAVLVDEVDYEDFA